MSDSSATGNVLVANSIFDNGGLSIDLGQTGTNANDPGDADTGANDLQNTPVVTNAYTDGFGGIEVSASLSSTPNTDFQIHFYGSGVADSSGIGDSKNYLGSAVITTDATGVGVITDAVISADLSIGEAVNATATSLDGNGDPVNTSEISGNVIAIERNAAPVIVSNDGGTIAAVNIFENQTETTTVLATDANGDTLSYAISGGSDAGLFSIDAANGVLTFVNPPSFENSQSAGVANNYVVEVEATDGQGGSDTQQLVIIVSDVNEAPEGDAVVAVSADENQSVAATAIATDPDGNTVTYAITGGADASLFLVDSANGNVSFLSQPNFEAPIDNDLNNSYELIVSASDPLGGILQQQITVAVQNINDAPDTLAVFTGTANEKQDYATAVLATDDENDVLSYSIAGGADAALFSIEPETGIVRFITAPLFASPIDNNADNTYELFVEISDGVGGTSQQQISIAILDVNEAPDLLSTLAVSIEENSTEVVTVDGADFEGETLTYSISGGLDAGAFTIDAQSGLLTFINPVDYDIPADSDSNNDYQVSVIVTDTSSGSAQQDITVSVLDINELPEMPEAASLNVNEYQSEVTTISAVDPEGGVLSYTISGGMDAELFSLDSETGILSFITPPNFETPLDSDENNTYALEVEVSDDSGGVSNQDITITVIDGNDAPIAMDDVLSANKNAKLTFDPALALLANDIDPEKGTLSLIDYTLPERGVLLLNAEGFMEYNPELEFTGEDSFTYIVEDDAGNQATASVLINVGEPPKREAQPENQGVTTLDPLPPPAPIDPSRETPTITSLPTITTTDGGTTLDGGSAGGFTSNGDVGAGSSAGVSGLSEQKDSEPGGVVVTDTVTESGSTSNSSLSSSSSSGSSSSSSPGSTSTSDSNSGGTSGNVTGNSGEEAAEGEEPSDADEVIKEPTRKFADDTRFGLKTSINTEHRKALKATNNSNGAVTENAAQETATETAATASENSVAVELSDSQQVSVLQSVFNLNLSPQARSAELTNSFESIRRQVNEVEEEPTRTQQAIALAPRVLAPSITVGIVTWMLRSGLLVAATISTTPVWRQLDLVPILAG